MKILQVTPFLSPVHGGSAEVPYQLSKELARRGHEVTLYTSDYKLGSEHINSIPGVKMRVFKAYSSMAKFFITPAMICQAKREVSDFDIIHLHNFYTFQNIVLHHYARKRNIPYLLQAHGSVGTHFQKGSLKRLFELLWGCRFLKEASNIIALTPTEVRQYEALNADRGKIVTVPNGIDLSEFKNLPGKGELKREYGLNEDHKIILYLGRIDRVKGIDLLAKAFAALSKELPHARLIIAGPDDGYLPKIKSLIRELRIEERVILAGPLYGKEKFKAYVDADVYVLPSSYEIFGITVVEALACGTPAIVTERCGIADKINGKAGVVVPYSIEHLRDAILQIMSEGNTRQQFGEAGKVLVQEELNWQKVAERLEQVYKGVKANCAIRGS